MGLAEDIDTDPTDPNTDVLAGLPWGDGYIAKYDGASGLRDCALDADSFADLATVCLPGDISVLEPVSGGLRCRSRRVWSPSASEESSSQSI